MQIEFDLHYPSLQVEILGMNQLGHEIGNPSITDGRDIPWLQDVDGDGDGQSDVWLNSWDFEYRDVVIVDDDGGYQSAFNVTQHNLAIPDNFQALKDRFIDVAATDPLTRWQSPIEPLDVNADSVIAPLDALLVINQIGNYPPNGVLPATGEVAAYIDTTGDGVVAPLDALLVINQLDVIAAHMAQEAAPLAPLSASAAVRPDDLQTEVLSGFDGEEIAESTSVDSTARVAATSRSAAPITIDLADDHRRVDGERSPLVDDATDAETDRIDDLFADLSWAEF